MRDTLIFLAILGALIAAMIGDLVAVTARRHRVMAGISLAAGCAVLLFYLADAVLNPLLGDAWQSWTYQNQTVGLILIPLAYIAAVMLAAAVGVSSLVGGARHS